MTPLKQIKEELKANCRRGFCLLVLKLIQSPDLTLDELRAVAVEQLWKSKDCRHCRFVENHFEKTLTDLNTIGMDYLLDVIDNFNRLITINETNRLEPTRKYVSKNSIVGMCILPKNFLD